MDRLDIRIIRELSQGRNVGLVWGDINPAYREMGLSLVVSKETIRGRVDKMRSSGVLKPFPVQPNPGLLGLSVGALTVDVPAQTSTAELMKRLCLVDGILLLVSHIGSMIGVIFYYEDDASRQKKVSLISSICSATAVGFTAIPYPLCSVGLSRRDWEIIAALPQRGERSHGEISSGLGISGKTLQRRLKRMIDGWAISRLISTDIRLLRGAVVGSLVVHYSRGAGRAEADKRLIRDLDEFLFFPGIWSTYSVYSLILPSIPDAAKVLERTRATKWVTSARIDLVDGRIELYDTLLDQVQKKLKGLAAAAT